MCVQRLRLCLLIEDIDVKTKNPEMSFCCWSITEFQTLPTALWKAVPATDIAQVRPCLGAEQDEQPIPDML